jgi:hypothetical protein
VAKTFFMQPRQYHRGYPGLLRLVIAPAPRKLKYPKLNIIFFYAPKWLNKRAFSHIPPKFSQK